MWRRFRIIVLGFAVMIITVFAINYIYILFFIPEKVRIPVGEEYVYELNTIFNISCTDYNDTVLNVGNINGIPKTDGSMSKKFVFKGVASGNTQINLRVLGGFAIKTLSVESVLPQKVIVCGNTVGIKIALNGLLVVGDTGVLMEHGKEAFPAGDAGVRVGDFIVEVNNKTIKDSMDLIREIDKSNGKSIHIKGKRGEYIYELDVTPIQAVEDSKYHIGIWVRDSTAGIGTMTFINPLNRAFGALGHGITDIDTGILMPVGKGDILKSSIMGVKKGEQGMPGELKGTFLEENQIVGDIFENNTFGVYGIINDNSFTQELPILDTGLNYEIKAGKAYILSNIRGKEIEQFEIEIVKINRNNIKGTKNMVIKITDDELLNSTGGIVQGMSGSPIIQNGKIVGAVTHVFINDPTRGYGVFLENMLESITSEVEKSDIAS